MSLKNLTDDNFSFVLSEIQKLDRKNKLRDRLIFETDYEGESIYRFSEAGFYTGHALNVERIRAISNLPTDFARKRAVMNLSAFISKQKIADLSFGIADYDLFLKHFPMTLSSPVDFHVRDAALPLNLSFLSKSGREACLRDDRVKTIRVMLPSDFSL